jgi:hypothetical protein
VASAVIGRFGEARGARGLEAERDRLADGKIGEAPGLRQRDADLGARLHFANQHRRIRAVEQQALDATGQALPAAGRSAGSRAQIERPGRA